MDNLINEIEEAEGEYTDAKSVTGEDDISDVESTKEIAHASPDATIEAENREEYDAVNYEAIIAEDLARLKTEFPELSNIRDITELENPLRYAALRDLGLDAAEAYLASTKRRRQDTRSHLRSAYGRSASSPPGMMTQRELSAARELFGNLSDSEIQRLYKKVTT